MDNIANFCLYFLFKLKNNKLTENCEHNIILILYFIYCKIFTFTNTCYECESDKIYLKTYNMIYEI